jgi:hypothetical protein
MTEQPSSVPADSGEVRFDRAEFAEGAPPPSCALCAAELGETYHEVDGAMACEPCRQAASSEVDRGTRGTRLLRALGAGVGAAAVGAGIYYAVLALTGYEFGLIAVVVGLMVGGAVRWGSHGRGGWLYQGLAMALTYGAIVSTYVPLIFEAMGKEPAKASVAEERADVAPASAALVAKPAAAGAAPLAEPAAFSGDVANGQIVETGAGDASRSAVELVSPGAALLALVVFAGFILAVPFLAGIENILGLLIIGFALFEAWKLNRRRRPVIAGPFRLASRDVEAGAGPAPLPAPAVE